MKKLFYIFLIIFNTLSLWYLFTPIPTIPNLTYAAKSNLPGDTVQLKNVSAFFTNLSRSEVINFYKANLNVPFYIRLNHPPEKAKEIIVDTIQSYYLEEFIIPFKESIFINGYEWQNDVFTKPEKRIAYKLIYNNINYSSKVTVKIFPTTIYERLIGFFATEFCLIFVFYTIVKFPWKQKK